MRASAAQQPQRDNHLRKRGQDQQAHSAPRLRHADTILRLLRNAAPKVVPLEDIAAAIWPGDRPQLWRGIIRRDVWGLRQSGISISARYGVGYVLGAGPDALCPCCSRPMQVGA